MKIPQSEALPSVDDGPVFRVGSDTVSDMSISVPAVEQTQSMKQVFLLAGAANAEDNLLGHYY